MADKPRWQLAKARQARFGRSSERGDLLDHLPLYQEDPIPVDAGYEAAAAARLVAEGRRFDKPLRFDPGQDQVFPDFWLLNAGDPLPMEVCGMSDADYIERKNEKTAHYDEKYGAGNWWQWDAASGVPLRPSRAPDRGLYDVPRTA